MVVGGLSKDGGMGVSHRVLPGFHKLTRGFIGRCIDDQVLILLLS